MLRETCRAAPNTPNAPPTGWHCGRLVCAQVRGKYIELKLEPSPSASTVLPSAREQMKG
jgi:hypothetical protein